MKKLTKKQVEKIRSRPVNFGMLDDAAHMILDGVQKLIDSLDTKIDFVHTDLKRQIDDLKYDTPTMKEFNGLKSRVDSYHPAS